MSMGVSGFEDKYSMNTDAVGRLLVGIGASGESSSCDSIVLGKHSKIHTCRNIADASDEASMKSCGLHWQFIPQMTSR